MPAHRRLRVVLASALAGSALVFAACHSYTSADAPDPDGGTSDGDPSGQTGDPADAGDDGPLPGTVDAAPAEGCPSAGHSCQPDAPDGWTGPLFVYDGDPSGLPQCPATMAVARINAHRGFHDPGPNTCTDCGCQSGDGQCTTTLHVFSDNCTTDISDVELGPATCGAVPAGDHYTIDSVPGATTTCPPSGGEVQAPPVQWDSATRACGAPSLLRTGCGDGQVCAPVAENPFRSLLCVSKTGDVDCPGDPYTVKLLTNGVDDERTCSKCTCGPATGTCTGMAFTYSGSESCMAVFFSNQSTPIGCTAADAGTSMREVSATATNATCTPTTTTSTPSGAATANDPITICCQN